MSRKPDSAPKPRRWKSALLMAACLCAPAETMMGAGEANSTALATFRQYCYACHGKAAKMGGVSLEQLTNQPNWGDHFQQWEKVATVLEQKRMPPAKMRQPSDPERSAAAQWIRSSLSEYATKHAGDPGRVTVRRLTGGEYTYTIHDLTGLDLKFDRDFASDSVGGEGFTNFGDVQFMADANLERYLEAAKRVADHAVIGAGPVEFYDDPGKSGFELSAINRINQIYRTYGFRANSGEGGKPYGLERYTQAFYACWRYQHRAVLGEPGATLASIATREAASPRFAEHIWSVLQDSNPTFPTSEVIAKWKRMPVPTAADREGSLGAGRKASETLMNAVVDWPRWLFAAGAAAEGGQGDERALVLNEAALQVTTKYHYKFPLRTRGKASTRLFLSVVAANGRAEEHPVVLWRNATIRILGKDRKLGPGQPLRTFVDEQTAQRIAFGKRADGAPIDLNDFASDKTVYFDVPTADGALGAELQVDAEINPEDAGDAVLRCTVSDAEEVSKGRPVWALLGNPKSPGYTTWKAGVLEYAARLPQNSQGEAAPSDKDPIPAPFDNTYNQPERDHFHAKAKYYRTDGFLMRNVLDDATGARLNQAWNDLLASFEYHDILFRFAASKYKLSLSKTRLADLTDADMEALPAEPRRYVKAFRAEYDAVQKAQLAAHPGHVEDCLRFAERAWRRPLSEPERDRLRSFYVRGTETGKLDHGKAIESLLARILVSPSFLYRLEQPAETSEAKPLSGWEIASRLSYFLWSSVPDPELHRAAAAGELNHPQQLARQVKRMVSDPKARRFATEFFGQWLGFYRFDQHRGVDTKRFPEFTDEVKTAMYDEAISFFEYIVRNDRPVREIFSADYTFLNQALAKHYGVTRPVKSTREPELVERTGEFHRGGLLRMGAVLTATSAPLRTSPVKRGDWVLRRILGTPTPPPPADAGSIPADDKLFGGMSVKQRLAAHQRNATCAACHSRIDPLGFPLERFDSVGRWRETYSDGKAVEDSSATADNTQINGIDGLLAYLKTQEPQVLRTMSNKLLGYALGRTVMASDQPLVDRLIKDGSDATFAQLVTDIVTSRQFRYRRERDVTSPASPQQISEAPAVKKTTKEGGL